MANKHDAENGAAVAGAAPCYAATFTQESGRVTFEKLGDRIDIHDPDNAWKDWYSLTTTQAHDLKCWLERMLGHNSVLDRTTSETNNPK